MTPFTALKGIAAALALSLAGTALAQSTLRIGLAEDPDVLDPTMARTYVGRIVFASICDKLFDIDDKLAIVPQLALGQETSADGKTVYVSLQENCAVAIFDLEAMAFKDIKPLQPKYAVSPPVERCATRMMMPACQLRLGVGVYGLKSQGL